MEYGRTPFDEALKHQTPGIPPNIRAKLAYSVSPERGGSNAKVSDEERVEHKSATLCRTWTDHISHSIRSEATGGRGGGQGSTHIWVH